MTSQAPSTQRRPHTASTKRPKAELATLSWTNSDSRQIGRLDAARGKVSSTALHTLRRKPYLSSSSTCISSTATADRDAATDIINILIISGMLIVIDLGYCLLVFVCLLGRLLPCKQSFILGLRFQRLSVSACVLFVYCLSVRRCKVIS